MIAFAKEPWFTSIMTTLGKKPWWALLGGTIATGIMQSSTAVIGVVQKLFTTGSITPAAGAAFIFGAHWYLYYCGYCRFRRIYFN